MCTILTSIALTNTSILLSSLHCLLLPLLLSDTCPRSPVPNIASPSHHSLYCSGRRYGRSNVEIEYRFASGFGGARVVIYHVSYFLLLIRSFALDEPIMPIERRFCAKLGCQSKGITQRGKRQRKLTRIQKDKSNPLPGSWQL